MPKEIVVFEIVYVIVFDDVFFLGFPMMKTNQSIFFRIFLGALKNTNGNVTSNEMAFLEHNFFITHFKLRNYLQATYGNSSPQIIYMARYKRLFFFRVFFASIQSKIETNKATYVAKNEHHKLIFRYL